jgi:hypothetical protein
MANQPNSVAIAKYCMDMV